MDLSDDVLGMRWGYGLPLPDGAPRSVDAMIAALAGPDVIAPGPAITVAEIVPPLNELRLKKKNSKVDPVLKVEVLGIERALSVRMDAAIAETFARALDNADGFRERLVQFWADHFTTANRSQYYALLPLTQAEEAIRPHVAGRFSDLLKASVLHPAMLSYLDQTLSVGPLSELGVRRGLGLNENLARELLELHTLGVGAGYSQADVYQTAELLTGYGFDLKSGGGFFDPRRAEPGPEWVLGRRYEEAGAASAEQLLDDLARRPETADHIARKLLVHFISDRPDQSDIDVVAGAFRDSDGDLKTVYRAMLSLGSSGQMTTGKVRQPFDFMIAGFRALSVTGDDLRQLDRKTFRRAHLDAMALMGQKFKSPRGPDGAAEDPNSWITAQGLAMRVNWSLAVASQYRGDLGGPDAVARRALGARADASLLTAVSRAEDWAEGVAILFSSPLFNRR